MTAEELRTLPKYQLIRALMDGTIPFDDVMRAFDVHTALHNLGPDILAMVYRSSQGRYFIIVNAFLEREHQPLVFFHELKHIIEDLPTIPHILGVDMHRSVIEAEADDYLHEVAAAVNEGAAADSAIEEQELRGRSKQGDQRR